MWGDPEWAVLPSQQAGEGWGVERAAGWREQVGAQGGPLETGGGSLWSEG